MANRGSVVVLSKSLAQDGRRNSAFLPLRGLQGKGILGIYFYADLGLVMGLVRPP